MKIIKNYYDYSEMNEEAKNTPKNEKRLELKRIRKRYREAIRDINKRIREAEKSGKTKISYDCDTLTTANDMQFYFIEQEYKVHYVDNHEIIIEW